MSDERARELLAADQLSPCPIPWCGGPARMGQGYPDMRERFIICEKCGLKTPHSKPFDAKGVAALWNKNDAIAAAIMAEREECAKVAETCLSMDDTGYVGQWVVGRISAAIRNRGLK